ncbi:MAG: hypothetical protein QXL02_03200 [Candidatus Anstonellales archaeon]
MIKIRADPATRAIAITISNNIIIANIKSNFTDERMDLRTLNNFNKTITIL